MYKVGNKWCVKSPSGKESCFLDRDAAEYYEQSFSGGGGSSGGSGGSSGGSGGGGGGLYGGGGGCGGGSGGGSGIVDGVVNVFKSLWGAVSNIAGGSAAPTPSAPKQDNTTLYLVGGAILFYMLLKR